MSERRTFAVAAVGKGKPDYQGEIWRGKIEKNIIHSLHFDERLVGLALMPTNTWVLGNPIPYARAPIPVAGSASLINMADGLAYVECQANFELEVIMLWLSMNQNSRSRTSFSLALPVPPMPLFQVTEMYLDANVIYFENEVAEFSTSLMDPTFAQGHRFVASGTNMGAAAMSGFTKIVLIERFHGTTLPTKKDVACNVFHNIDNVPITTTSWICTACGQTSVYSYFPWGGDLPKTPVYKIKR